MHFLLTRLAEVWLLTNCRLVCTAVWIQWWGTITFYWLAWIFSNRRQILARCINRIFTYRMFAKITNWTVMIFRAQIVDNRFTAKWHCGMLGSKAFGCLPHVNHGVSDNIQISHNHSCTVNIFSLVQVLIFRWSGKVNWLCLPFTWIQREKKHWRQSGWFLSECLREKSRILTC